jgi:hypothetical protein
MVKESMLLKQPGAITNSRRMALDEYRADRSAHYASGRERPGTDREDFNRDATIWIKAQERMRFFDVKRRPIRLNPRLVHAVRYSGSTQGGDQ